MSEAELLTQFKRQHGPVILALPRSRSGLQTHLFCSDGIHLPRFHRLWDEPLCGGRTFLPHCTPQSEDWPSCEQCQQTLRRLLAKACHLQKGR